MDIQPAGCVPAVSFKPRFAAYVTECGHLGCRICVLQCCSGVLFYVVGLSSWVGFVPAVFLKERHEFLIGGTGHGDPSYRMCACSAAQRVP